MLACLAPLLALSAWAGEISVPPLPSPRVGLGAVEVAGALCVVGGSGEPPRHAPVAKFECYDPKTRRWTARAPSSRARLYAKFAALGDRLYAIGGAYLDRPAYTAEFDVYEPAADAWRAAASSPYPLIGPGTAVHKGALYVVGGWNGKKVLSGLLRYEPGSGAWTSLAPMPTPRSSPAAGFIGGILFAAGGYDPARGPGRFHLNVLEAYDPETGLWETRSPMLVGAEPAHAVAAGRLYAFGGNSGGQCSAVVQAYDPEADRWAFKSPMPLARCNAAAAAKDGLVYLFGGNDTSGSTSHLRVDVYSVAEDRWLTGAPAAPPAAPPPAPPVVQRRSDVDELEGPDAAPRPDDFALVVGIEDYRALPAADYAESDAGAFRDYARRVLGVPEENIVFLSGQRAALTDLSKYLDEWLPRNVSEKSRVYFYYSGHGAPDPDGTAYLVAWDGDPAFLKSSAYPLPRLYERLESLKAREVVVLLDSCFSGAGGRSVIAKGTRPLVTSLVPQAPPGSKLSILTAASGDEITGSLDEERHGLFTYHLLKGLRGEADGDKDGHLTIGELHTFVRKAVSKGARRQNREQTPQLQPAGAALSLF